MHIVDVTMFHSPHGGGVGRYLGAKQAFLHDAGVGRHTLVVPGPIRGRSPQVPGLPLPFSCGYRVALGRRSARRIISALQPDIIEAGDPFQLAWAALDAGRGAGIPVVAFYHCDLPALAFDMFGALGRRGASAYARRLYRQFDLVLAPSLSAKSALDALGVTRVAHQPLGVDTAWFHPGRRDPQWRTRLGIGRDDCVLLYVGRHAPEKNLPVLRDAVRLLGPGYVLVTIGSGPCPISGARVRALGHERNADKLIEAMASADIFVHAGSRETFGLAVLEALACGLPVVACARAALCELVDQNVGAALVHCTAADFAEAINALRRGGLEAPALAARQRALRHDWKLVLPSLVGHYRTLIKAA